MLGLIKLKEANDFNQNFELFKKTIITDPIFQTFSSIQKTKLKFHAKDDHVAIKREVYKYIANLDFSVQVIVRRKSVLIEQAITQFEYNKQKMKGGIPMSSSICVEGPGYDPRRGLSLAADGMFLSGPLLHFAFEFMEHVLPSQETNSKSWISTATILHVLANDFLVDTIYLFLSFIFVALAEGLAKDLPNLIRKDFPTTLQASWGTSAVFMPVEYLCFSRLPLSLRVLSMNLIDVVWGSIISYVTHRSRRPLETNQIDEHTPLDKLKHDTIKLE